MRVGIPKEFHCQGMSMEVVEAWTDVADMLADAGAIVEQVCSLSSFYGVRNISLSTVLIIQLLNRFSSLQNCLRFQLIIYCSRFL